MTWLWTNLATADQRKRASQQPMRFFLTELVRHAALMSLFLAVQEWIWPTFTFAGEPGKRLFFIAFTSAWMAAFQLWFARPRVRRSNA